MSRTTEDYKVDRANHKLYSAVNLLRKEWDAKVDFPSQFHNPAMMMQAIQTILTRLSTYHQFHGINSNPSTLENLRYVPHKLKTSREWPTIADDMQWNAERLDKIISAGSMMATGRYIELLRFMEERRVKVYEAFLLIAAWKENKKDARLYLMLKNEKEALKRELEKINTRSSQIQERIHVIDRDLES